MDPNANLGEQRVLADKLLESDDPDVVRIAELVQALDAWLKAGGFLPDDWGGFMPFRGGGHE